MRIARARARECLRVYKNKRTSGDGASQRSASKFLLSSVLSSLSLASNIGEIARLAYPKVLTSLSSIPQGCYC